MEGLTVNKKVWTGIIGKFQTLTNDKIKTIRSILNKDENVAIILLKDDGSEGNKKGFTEREEMIKQEFDEEINARRIMFVRSPNIDKMIRGKGMEWKIERPKADKLKADKPGVTE